MKKGIILVVLSLLLAVPAMGQKKLVKSIERMANKEKTDLVEASKLLEPAFANEETANDPHTWYVAGLIQEKNVEKSYLAMQLGQQIDEPAFYNSLMEMALFYAKSNELDSRKKFKTKISNALKTFAPLLINGGAMYMESNDFVNANKFFQKFLDVKKMDIFEGTPMAETDSMSMEIGFYNAYAASQIEGNTENAIKAYESIKNIPYRQNDVYQLLSVQYYQANDKENFVKTLQEGAKLFPQETFYVNNLVDSYIKDNKLDDAKNYLDVALSENPNSAQLLYVYGILYENGYQDSEKAVEYFKKSVEVDPTYSQGYFGIGRYYFNSAHTILNNADISNQAKYKEASTKGDSLFKQAIPYFQKAIELEPDNKDFLNALGNTYYALGMEAERAEIQAKIDGL